MTTKKTAKKSAKKTAAKKAAKKTAKKAAKKTEPDDVAAFMAATEHPRRTDIARIIDVIGAVSPTITCAIKWNAPSFRTAVDFFATFHLRSTDPLQLVFHTGAKVKATATSGVQVDDPRGLLRWLAKDRAILTLPGNSDDELALAAIVKQWLAFV